TRAGDGSRAGSSAGAGTGTRGSADRSGGLGARGSGGAAGRQDTGSRPCVARSLRRGRSACVRPADTGAAQLLHQHVREPQALALAHLRGHLVVVHLLIEVRLVGAEDRILEARLAHALQHHAGEEALELPRGLAQCLRIAVRGRLLQRGKVAGSGELAGIYERNTHMTMSWARSAPASFNASRIATRSPGAAPTEFTAVTISLRLTPAGNLNMCAFSCFTSSVLRGVTAVVPLLNAFGWLTSERSVIETVSDPLATAAANT